LSAWAVVAANTGFVNNTGAGESDACIMAAINVRPVRPRVPGTTIDGTGTVDGDRFFQRNRHFSWAVEISSDLMDIKEEMCQLVSSLRQKSICDTV
jgi:hypothetical protein